jgi:hypothetical protein
MTSPTNAGFPRKNLPASCLGSFETAKHFVIARKHLRESATLINDGGAAQ